MQRSPIKYRGNYNCIYLCGHKSGPHPGHIYQGEAVNAQFAHYLDIPCFAFKRYDLILSEGFRPLITGSFIKQVQLVRRHINILLGDFIPSVAKRSNLKSIIDSIINDGCDGFIANSTLTAEIFRKTFGDKYSRKLRVCYPSLTPSFIRSRFSAFKQITDQRNIDSLGICSFLYLNYSDGADLLPEIFRLVQKELGTKICMYVISSTYEKKYKELLLKKAKELVNFNIILGHHSYDFIKTLFRRCQVFLYPARLKFFGLPVIEAMYDGLIPIVTEMTGAKDFVEKIDLKLITSLNSKTIAERVIEVLSMDQKDLLELSLRARNTILEWNRKSKDFFIKNLRALLELK